MRFGILGPLQVDDDGAPLAVQAPKQRALLAILLVYANEVVATDRLIELLWNGRPPAGAVRALHVHLSGLRRALHPLGPGRSRDGLLARQAPGYVLRLEPDTVDLHQFDALIATARQARRDGDLLATVAHLQQALGLWRGPALAGIDVTALQHTVVPRLEEARLTAAEDRIDAELALGRHHVLVGQLQALAAEQPLRERLQGQLMVALYRSGRRGEALAAYTEARRRLVEELGLEPGVELQRLQRRVLTGDPVLMTLGTVSGEVPAGEGGHQARPVPRQLPADIATFTGRATELARMERVLGAADRTGPVIISAIDGTGGIGKSALAIHAAHAVAEQYPDGQLYVDLQGATIGLAPLEPVEVLGRFLRALGMNGADVPAALDEAAAHFRSLVAGRRLLVVLDNARDTEQVRPLLPGAHGCGVLVTSRRVLARLDGVSRVTLEVLGPDESVVLLGRLVGEERIAAEPDAAREVARWCGYLPLALRIAGARLAARPAWSVRLLADRLADQHRRLSELELADDGVRASFAVSYQESHDSPDPADQAAAGAFLLLGVPEGPDLSVQAAARLLDQPDMRTEQVLERLVDARLLETPAPGRYRLHDLLRLFARERAATQHGGRDQVAALTRALGFYTASAWHTLSLLRPGDWRLAGADPRWIEGGLRFADASAALDWLEAERANLLAAIAQAARSDEAALAGLAGQLTRALFGFFDVRSYWQNGIQANSTALRLARRIQDRVTQAHAANTLAGFHIRVGRSAEAITCLRESLAIFRELGDRRGQADSLSALGCAYAQHGRSAEAITCLQRSLAIDRELGYHRGQSASLSNLCLVYQRMERYTEAIACQQEALAIERDVGDRRGQAYAYSINNLGSIYALVGRSAEAISCLRESLSICQELGDRYGRAFALNNLGVAYSRMGRPSEAVGCQQDSLTLFRELGDRHGQAESLKDLGDALRAAGRHDQAQAAWHEALALCEAFQIPKADELRTRIAAPQFRSDEFQPASER